MLEIIIVFITFEFLKSKDFSFVLKELYSIYDDKLISYFEEIEFPVKAINIYKDESRKDNYSYYTYTAISASLIKLVKLDKI